MVALVLGCGSGEPGSESANADACAPCNADTDCGGGLACVDRCCAEPRDPGDAADASVGPGVPRILVTPAAIDFGAPILGVEISIDVTVINLGDGALRISRVRVEENDETPELSADPSGDVAIDVPAGDFTTLRALVVSIDGEEDSGRYCLETNDPEAAETCLPMTAALRGEPAICVCPLAPSGDGDPRCRVDDPEISFDGIAHGAAESRDAAIFNCGDGNRLLAIDAVAVTDETAFSGLFAVALYRLEGADEVEVALPVALAPAGEESPAEGIYARVGFTADDDGGTVPAEALRVTATGEVSEAEVDVPIVGVEVGCPAGLLDADGSVENGCEFSCTPTGAELCDGLDNDCAGGADDGCDDDGDDFCDAAMTTAETPPLGCPWGGGDCDDATASVARCENAHGETACVEGACVPACDDGWGDCDGDPGGGCEQSLTTGDHCGGCDVACDLPAAEETCALGACQVVFCAPGSGDCNALDDDGCERPFGTVSDCGDCGVGCGNDHGSTACTGDLCAPVCDDGWADCDGNAGNGCETDIAAGVDDCGGCGHACGNPHGGVACTGGACVPACDDGWASCDGDPDDGCETSTRTLARCGGCDAACDLAHAAETCVTGACLPTSCTLPWEDCDGDPGDGCETSLIADETCGGCEAPCANAHGSTLCTGDSLCQPACDDGFGDCDGDPWNGCETGTEASTDDCGACGNVCGNAHGGFACAGGACDPTCAPGWGDCDGNPDNGCETPLTTPADCGACDALCTVVDAATSCLAGACTSSICDPGTADCDGGGGNGCEADLTSEATCGSCAVACVAAHGDNACAGGTCVPTCDPSWDDCDGNPANGCETDLLASDAHCGACGTVCADFHGANGCVGGACSVVCDASWASCDGSATNGCETAATTATNCGGCGIACDLPNASESCASGACALVSCNTGWGDCAAAAGCETPLTTTTNCGACFAGCTALNGTQACAGGTCVPSCAAGWASCDGDPSNGCETDLGSSDGNCGACGTTCADVGGTNLCAGGTCTPSCAAGSGNCDGIGPNGCETSLGASNTNCGACGVACADVNGSSTCVGGACAATCDPGFGNCDASGTNGCETSTSASDAHCGTCGNACVDLNSTNTCTGGVCTPACFDAWASCDGNVANGCETSTRTLTNCGTCGTPCGVPFGGETCITGSCAVDVCDAGRAHCDADVTGNGCERVLDAYANTCATATTMTRASDGATYIRGDYLSDYTPIYTGYTSQWFKLTVNENFFGPPGPDPVRCIQSDVELQSPPGLDFDLYRYDAGCGPPLTPNCFSAQVAGATDTMTHIVTDVTGNQDHTYWIEVRYFGGSVCGSWTLQAYRASWLCSTPDCS